MPKLSRAERAELESHAGIIALFQLRAGNDIFNLEIDHFYHVILAG